MHPVPTQYSHRTAIGHISDAYRAPSVIFIKQRHSAAQRLGLKFEEKALKRLSTLTKGTPWELTPQPHYRFSLEGSLQSIFPDAILENNLDTLCIVECKYRHTFDGWNQLSQLYTPVILRAHPKARILRLEICKNYDPLVKLPEEKSLVFDLLEWLSRGEISYGVYILGR